MTLAYNGKNYHGWQKQPNATSVQAIVENSLSTILRNPTNIVAAGRTDSGVHAAQMIAHFDTDQHLDPIKFIYQFNALLPDTIVGHAIKKVRDDAHARFDASSRKYEYRIYLGRNPFLLDTTWQIRNKHLDVEAMNQATKLLFDYTDFQCFSKVKTDVKTFDCTILEAHWVLVGNHLTFHIKANRFLRNMVRAIVGTLLEVGQEKTSLKEFSQIIESKSRSNAGLSVPAQGLFLTEILY